MSMMERNTMQMKMAQVIARRRGIDLLAALDVVKVPFAALYAHTYAR